VKDKEAWHAAVHEVAKRVGPKEAPPLLIRVASRGSRHVD